MGFLLDGKEMRGGGGGKTYPSGLIIDRVKLHKEYLYDMQFIKIRKKMVNGNHIADIIICDIILTKKKNRVLFQFAIFPYQKLL